MKNLLEIFLLTKLRGQEYCKCYLIYEKGCDVLFFYRDEHTIGTVEDFTIILARIPFNRSVYNRKQFFHILNEHLVEQPLIPHLQANPQCQQFTKNKKVLSIYRTNVKILSNKVLFLFGSTITHMQPCVFIFISFCFFFHIFYFSLYLLMGIMDTQNSKYCDRFQGITRPP